jgi:hypothetical protein
MIFYSDDLYTVDITVKITLSRNEIFYPREDTEEARMIYLHELGHQLDAWGVVPKEGITFTVRVESDRFHGTKEEIEEAGNLWLQETEDSLKKDYRDEYIGKIDETGDSYHKKWGNAGNPWDGYRE